MVTIHTLGPVDVVVQDFDKDSPGKVLLRLPQGSTIKGCLTLSLKEVVIGLLSLIGLSVEESMKGQNIRVRLPGTTLRVLEEDPNPWPSKLPRQLKVVLRGSGSALRTCSTIGQKVAPRRRDTADSTISNLIYRKLVGTPPCRGLVSRQNLPK
uniref:Uncharacterized protein n=1 Tax=Solanum tuberosum TaxID=4113 RepID=M1DVX9_SOLTU